MANSKCEGKRGCKEHAVGTLDTGHGQRARFCEACFTRYFRQNSETFSTRHGSSASMFIRDKEAARG